MKNIQFIKSPKDILNQFGKISVIIFNENEKYKEIYKTFPKLEIEKFSPFSWCEKFLNRIQRILCKRKMSLCGGRNFNK